VCDGHGGFSRLCSSQPKRLTTIRSVQTCQDILHQWLDARANSVPVVFDDHRSLWWLYHIPCACMNKTVPPISFLMRHVFASVVSIVWPPIAIVIGYVLLLLLALVTHSGMGSPIALPLWAFFALLTSIMATVTLLFPATSIAELITHRMGKSRHLIQIPLSTLILALIIMLLSAVVSLVRKTQNETYDWLAVATIVFLVLAIPLGVYWWAMKMAQAAVFVILRLVARIFHLRSDKTGSP
jgi:hypothetical protein